MRHCGTIGRKGANTRTDIDQKEMDACGAVGAESPRPLKLASPLSGLSTEVGVGTEAHNNGSDAEMGKRRWP